MSVSTIALLFSPAGSSMANPLQIERAMMLIVCYSPPRLSKKRFCRRCQGAFLEFCDPPSLVGKARPANGIWDMWDNNILSGEGHRRCRRRSGQFSVIRLVLLFHVSSERQEVLVDFFVCSQRYRDALYSASMRMYERRQGRVGMSQSEGATSCHSGNGKEKQ